jgi:hypothetical protein
VCDGTLEITAAHLSYGVDAPTAAAFLVKALVSELSGFIQERPFLRSQKINSLAATASEYTLMGECYVHRVMQGELMSTARCAMNTIMQTIEEGEDFMIQDGEAWLVPAEEVDVVKRPMCGFFWEEVTII